VDDYMQLPNIPGIRAVSLWMKKSTVQAKLNPYLLDGRSGGDSEAYFSKSSVGISWVSMHIDGVLESTIAWSRLPSDAWIHLHLETQYAFSAAMTLYARSGGSDFMQVRCWLLHTHRFMCHMTTLAARFVLNENACECLIWSV